MKTFIHYFKNKMATHYVNSVMPTVGRIHAYYRLDQNSFNTVWIRLTNSLKLQPGSYFFHKEVQRSTVYNYNSSHSPPPCTAPHSDMGYSNTRLYLHKNKLRLISMNLHRCFQSRTSMINIINRFFILYFKKSVIWIFYWHHKWQSI